MKRRIIIFCAVAAFVYISLGILYQPNETVVPDGQEYRPSGASSGHPPGVEFMKEREGGLDWDQAYDAPDSLYGISIDALEGSNDTYEAAIYIGEGWDCMIATEKGCILGDGTMHWSVK